METFRTLRADEIDCRVATVKSAGVTLLLYKDAVISVESQYTKVII